MSEADIVARLRNPAMIVRKAEVGEGADYPVLSEEQVRADMTEAADLIEILRGRAGAVTPGPNLVDLRGMLKTPPDKPKTEYPDWMSMK